MVLLYAALASPSWLRRGAEAAQPVAPATR
jgi:hypothetical protein